MLSASQKELLTETANRYATSLTPQAQSYLSERGITPEVANTFLLGSVVEPGAGHEHATNRLSIPYISPTGVVGIKFRAIDRETKSKYIYPTGKRSGYITLLIFIRVAILLPFARVKLTQLYSLVWYKYLLLVWLEYHNGRITSRDYSSLTVISTFLPTMMLKRTDVILAKNWPSA